jgi:hypothetical protein
MTWALKLEDKNLKKNLELKIYTGKKTPLYVSSSSYPLMV